MSRLTVVHQVPTAESDRFLRPRDDVVAEARLDHTAPETAAFGAAEGPFERYERRVTVEDRGGGAAIVTEHFDFKLAIGFWSVLFLYPLRRTLARPPQPGHAAWWAPPDRLDLRAAQVLALLAWLALIGGYLGTLITQTLTFAASEFGASKAAQGTALAATRVGVVIALVLAVAADRVGRRRMLRLAATAGCLITITGAFSPTLPALAASQTVARGFASALLLLVFVVSAEEMPKSSRAYAFGLITMSAALGAGVCLWLLPLADTGTTGWRLLYLFPLLAVPLIASVHRRLPESRRFVAAHAEAPMAGHGRRFALLATSAFLLAVFAAPASQFQNEFLRDERAFSAARISLFVLVTSTPGALGVMAGGRWADVRGRQLVGAIGIVGGTILTVARFAASGWPMWACGVAGSVVAGLVVPALGVYRPELFPTSLRGKANGTIEVLSVIGSGAGLLAVGFLVDRWGSFARPLLLLAAAPLVVAVLVMALYPETAHRSLEELNPEDAAASSRMFRS